MWQNDNSSKENYLKLLSIIAHNIKAPIKYMGFITDFTLRNWTTMKPEDLLDCATLINEAASDISEQLEGLLNWARLHDGTFQPNSAPFALKQLVTAELRIHRTILTLKSIAVVNEVDEQLIINSDSNLLRLAMHNILLNAIKFTAKNGSISISASIENNLASICITDTGVGIKPEELALLYDGKSFSNPGTLHEQGSGFGLRISKEILDILGGSIGVASTLGVGTTVTIFLPA